MNYLNEALENKWGPILDFDGVGAIKDKYKRAVTAVLLENTQEAIVSESNILTEAAPTNSTGASIANYDPVLISLVRRALPNLISYDVCGVQPMNGPVGLIFALRSRYKTQSGTEALFNEANTAFGSTNAAGANGNISGSTSNTNPVLDLLDSSTYGVGLGMTTAQGEGLGNDSGNAFAEMAFSIEKVSVTAQTTALKVQYSLENAQDIKAIHGLDLESELINILSTEATAELNRRVIRSIYRSASLGSQYGVASAGTFNLDTDSDGRWSVEKWKGMIYRIEREASAIAKATRRGRGNIVICSADVASALAMAEVLDYTPALSAELNVDDTGNTFVGVLHGRIKVFIDPYFGGSGNGDELLVVGYKGASPLDAGLFYAPYVPFQFVRAVDPLSFQPALGLKTRAGLVANPFATTAGDGVVGDRNNAAQANVYYRIQRIRGL